MKLLSWQEPRAYRHAAYRNEIQGNRWLRLKLAGLIFGMLLIPWAIRQLSPEGDAPLWWISLPILAGGSIAFAYGLPWLFRLVPAEVRLLEKKIVRIHGNSARHVPLGKIQGYTFDHLHGFEVVRFEIERQPPLFCALREPSQQVEVERVLAELRIPRLSH